MISLPGLAKISGYEIPDDCHIDGENWLDFLLGQNEKNKV